MSMEHFFDQLCTSEALLWYRQFFYGYQKLGVWSLKLCYGAKKQHYLALKHNNGAQKLRCMTGDAAEPPWKE